MQNPGWDGKKRFKQSGLPTSRLGRVPAESAEDGPVQPAAGLWRRLVSNGSQQSRVPPPAGRWNTRDYQRIASFTEVTELKILIRCWRLPEATLATKLGGLGPALPASQRPERRT